MKSNVVEANTSPKSSIPKVYKTNKLNKANFRDFSLNDYQVALYLISKIGGVDKNGKYLQPSELKRSHTVTAKEFSEIFSVALSNSYTIIEKACKKLMQTQITIESLESETSDKSDKYHEINICSMAEYKRGEGRISITFTDSIMPYLAQVNKKFTLYNLKEIANFKSLYTTRLYELLQSFKETGWFVISIEDLKHMFAISKQFKRYADFKRKVIVHACNEINSHYNLGLKFEEIKESRKVASLKFKFKKVDILKITDPNTGIVRNIYTKPVKSEKSNTDGALEGKLSFHDSKDSTKKLSDILAKTVPQFLQED